MPNPFRRRAPKLPKTQPPPSRPPKTPKGKTPKPKKKGQGGG